MKLVYSIVVEEMNGLPIFTSLFLHKSKLESAGSLLFSLGSLPSFSRLEMEQDKKNFLSVFSNFSLAGVEAKQENFPQLSLTFSQLEMKQDKKLFSQLSLKL